MGLKPKEKSKNSVSSWYGVNQFKIILSGLKIPKLRIFLHGIKMAFYTFKRKPNVVFGRSLIGCYFATIVGMNVFYETHDPISVLNKVQRLFFNRLLKSPRLGGIIVISEALKKLLLGQSSLIRPDDIFVAHDGATKMVLTNSDIESYQWPTENDKFQVGYVGTISQGRGIEIIIQLAQNFPMCDFHIIGGEKKQLINFNIDIPKNCDNVFFHGFVSPYSAALARRRCDILLAPYQEKTILKSGKNTAGYMSPLKIFEYMEAGKAIISSDLPVLREVLTNRKNALMVAPDKIDEWLIALEELLRDKELRSRLEKSAFEIFNQKYTWQMRAKNILSFISQKNKL
jgi:glycosyltransferase involved in cell wall biosynthesis